MSGGPLLDIYDNERLPSKRTGKIRRFGGCRHEVPCAAFRCMAPHHRGPRATPWCEGHDCDEIDVDGDWCDTCWDVIYRYEESR